MRRNTKVSEEQRIFLICPPHVFFFVVWGERITVIPYAKNDVMRQLRRPAVSNYGSETQNIQNKKQVLEKE